MSIPPLVRVIAADNYPAGIPALMLAIVIFVGAAWRLVLPVDRRWFIPASPVVIFWFWVWLRPIVMYGVGYGRKVIVHRLTASAELTGLAPDPVPLQPYQTR